MLLQIKKSTTETHTQKNNPNTIDSHQITREQKKKDLQ